MSQENVEIVQVALSAVNREDWQAVFEGAGRDAEVDLSRAVGLDRGVYRMDQFRRLAEEFGKSWESVRYEADEFIEAGEHVVTPFTNRLPGRDGVEVQARGTWLWTIRDGVITRLCLYQELRCPKVSQLADTAVMSEATVEIVRGLVAAWNQRDPQLAAGFLTADVEWAPAGPAAVERVVYRGPEECARGFASVWETWEEFRFEEKEVRDLGDSVLWLGRVHMKGGASQLELDQEFANLFLLRDGLIARATAFLGWAEALRAAGLEA